jgi:hypothetical protein
MYFSVHCVMHVCSLPEMELPGLGTHFSKQFSFIFYDPCVSCLALGQDAGRYREHTSMSCRALAVLDSRRICLMSACLTDSEDDIATNVSAVMGRVS